MRVSMARERRLSSFDATRYSPTGALQRFYCIVQIACILRDSMLSGQAF